MTEEVADAVQPVYAAVCRTGAKILSRMKELKASEDKPQR